MVFSLRFEAHSEVGRIRKNNQDSGYASPTMLVVADGMGGAAAGDLASAVAAVTARDADAHLYGHDMLPHMQGIIDDANARLAELVSQDLTLDGMGTTFCGAMFDGEQLALTHIAIEFETVHPQATLTASVTCSATVETVGPTGVEMEALTAVQVALLTIYDMCKAVDRRMTINDVRLLEKHGGKSGRFVADPPAAA